MWFYQFTKFSGVIVLEDVSARGFRTYDSSLQLFDFDHLRVAVEGLAELHAIVIAHDLLEDQKLVILYNNPIPMVTRIWSQIETEKRRL